MKVKPITQTVQVFWLPMSRSVCLRFLVQVNSFGLLVLVRVWVYDWSDGACAFCLFLAAFSEHGVNTCSGRSPRKSGAPPRPPCPQTSWAALSAWTPSPIAAHPWVHMSFSWLGWPVIWSPGLWLQERNLGMWAGGLWSTSCLFAMVRVLSSQTKMWVMKAKRTLSRLRELTAFEISLNYAFVCWHSSVTFYFSW